MKDKITKVLAVTLLLALSLPLCSFADAIQGPDSNLSNDVLEETRNLDEIDLMLAAHFFMNSENQDEDFWPEQASIHSVVPLYTPYNEICAYYVRLTSGGYAVINNNCDNPAAIEFGMGGNKLIDDILADSPETQIVYNNPNSVYRIADASVTDTISLSDVDLYTYYSDLKDPNSALSDVIAAQREQIENQLMPLGDGDYGFIGIGSMPSGSYYSDLLPVTGISWAITNDYNSYYGQAIYNHCGAVCVTNIVLYYQNAGYTNLNTGNKHNAFYSVYPYIGNGPVTLSALQSGAIQYFSQKGYNLNVTGTGSWSGLKTAIGQDYPCAILLSEAINDWHWVVCVGWREYSQNDYYMQIVDGWYDTCNTFYKPFSGSQWVSGVYLWID